jgi:hypothetical protein
MVAALKTPEREAFYKKIDGENLSGRICGNSTRCAPS